MANTVQVATRITPDMKEQASRIFAKYGLDMASALRMFIALTVTERKLPLNDDSVAVTGSSRIDWDAPYVIHPDPKTGVTVLPAQMDDASDAYWDTLYPPQAHMVR
jgi:addiction module RelB/DinJ family antitoxin